MEAKELMENIVKVLDSKKAKDIRAIRIGDLTILENTSSSPPAPAPRR